MTRSGRASGNTCNHRRSGAEAARLQSAEDRIKDLEADVRYFQERAERAEQWLSQISSEIEQRFFRVADSRRPQDRPQRQKGR